MLEKEEELEQFRLHVPREMGTEEVNFLLVSFQDEQFLVHGTLVDLDLKEHILNHWMRQPLISWPSSLPFAFGEQEKIIFPVFAF